MEPRFAKAKVLESIGKLYKGFGRPVHIADLKKEFKILEKDSSRKNTNCGRYRVAKAISSLFKENKISRSESLVRVENYPVSPYSSVKKSATSNVYFFAPVDLAGKELTFAINGKEITQKFVSYDAVKGNSKSKSKKEMILDFIKNSDRALTVNEILDFIQKEYKAYKIESKRDFYNATSSLTRAVLKKLRKEGLKGRKLDNRWIWYFTEEQLKRYKEHYVRSDPVLSLVEDLVKSEKCVPLMRILSELQISPEEAKYRIRKVAKFVPVKINVATTTKESAVEIEVFPFQRDSFLDWLGMVVPKSQEKDGFGYETMLVYLDSDWQDELKTQIRKSLSRINVRAVIGNFYEKLVAKLFNMLCTSEELQSSELSRYMIPFVFRDKVNNVWVTMESGRRGEFDVLLRGTFNAFNAMTDGKPFLDIIVPIESKYTIVKPEHVTHFDDKIRNVFGDRRNVIPILIGLTWSSDAMDLAKRFGILTIYFEAVTKLVRAMTGTRYRHEHEWKQVERLMNEGKLSIEELRRQLDNQEYKFLFEEYIKTKLNENKITGGIVSKHVSITA
jgi:hypothetical protein